MGKKLFAVDEAHEDDAVAITEGDVAILQFLAAAELIESDLWRQYNELGGVDAANSGYVAALAVLDGDMSQYISDNTDDEISHETFLNAYLGCRPPRRRRSSRDFPRVAETARTTYSGRS
jgi:hypothetical protein